MRDGVTAAAFVKVCDVERTAIPLGRGVGAACVDTDGAATGRAGAGAGPRAGTGAFVLPFEPTVVHAPPLACALGTTYTTTEMESISSPALQRSLHTP